MAGPFSRLRRGDAEPPASDAPAEGHEPGTDDTVVVPAPDGVGAGDASAAGTDTAGTDAGADGTDIAATDRGAGGAEAATGVMSATGTDTAATDANAAGSDDAAGDAAATDPRDEPHPRLLERGKLRRRLRYVRRAREVALRDLGGLVFDLHRFGRDRGDLVEQKLAGLSALDGEMRALETVLDDRREITVLREPGLASCPRCGALHASDAHFCSACGLPLDRRADLPVGPAPAGPAGLPAPTPTPGGSGPANGTDGSEPARAPEQPTATS